MNKREFIDRCLATQNVSIEQAEAFHSKLWRLHVDAKYASTAKPNDIVSLSSAAPGDQRPSFQERIRPGMVIGYDMSKAGGAAHEMAVVFSEAPLQAAESGSEGKQYLCAVVSKGEYLNAYVVNLWHQRVVKVEDMTREVVLEYDPATRYYYPVI
jgi:kinesin family protein 2/24